MLGSWNQILSNEPTKQSNVKNLQLLQTTSVDFRFRFFFSFFEMAVIPAAVSVQDGCAQLI